MHAAWKRSPRRFILVTSLWRSTAGFNDGDQFNLLLEFRDLCVAAMIEHCLTLRS